MSLVLEQRLQAALAAFLQARYSWRPAVLVVEQPPKPELGDFALPLCFELAKQLRRPPRALAQEITAQFPMPQGFVRAEVAGGGYLNFFVDRSAAAASLATGNTALQPWFKSKVIVEHTNINPNKAAHIGHLRNAVLGDTWVRLLRARGETVEVQNLQDNTGVQVADVVAAFLHLDPDLDIAAATLCTTGPQRFDYLCWDAYARISQHYETHPEDLKAWRGPILHALERGAGPIAELGMTISNAIALAHLRTMARLGISYDLLPRESEILGERLWVHAANLMRSKGALRLEADGKNKGCWVMNRPGHNAEGEEDTKVFVRSDGSVTYVAKDVAYQLWKFGLITGLAFKFQPLETFPATWRTAPLLASPSDAPCFGGAGSVFNVIDVRQSYLQEIVADSLRALGFMEQADRSIHFSYEMVSLSPACAAELGLANDGDKRVDVSGRKGTGVKADDLIDRLIARTSEEVAARHPELSQPARAANAHAIAVGALRYFLLRFTRTTLIEFDFKQALSFEGETGPYIQYAAVRAANILAKAGANRDAAFDPVWAPFLDDTTIWQLLWRAGRLDAIVDASIEAREPAHLAKYAFQLAQAFNAFYHHHPVTQEADPARRAFLLWLVAQLHRQLTLGLEIMGIAVPAAM